MPTIPADVQPASVAAPPRAATPSAAREPRAASLRHIRVPVIARLAVRTLPIRVVRAFSPGSIVEFARSVETPVEVLINNRVVALAQVVKVGEHFGLRVTQIVDAARRIESCRG